MNSYQKARITSNKFVDQVRISMIYDDGEYKALCAALESLADTLKGSDNIDKELALYLYSIPLMTRNAFLSFDSVEPKPEIAAKLEDAWIELDSLVTTCLAD